MSSTTRALIVLLALALIAAACGDDDAATTIATTAPGDTTAATSAPSTSIATSGGVVEDGTANVVGDLLARFETTPLRTTYLLGTGDDQTEIILAQDPTATPPVESIFIVQDGSKIIISEGVTIFCDSSNRCFEVPGGAGDSLVAGLLGPLASGVFLSSSGDGVVSDAAVSEEPITVAGRGGVCFTYEAPAGSVSDTSLVRQCIDSEFGFTLLLETEETTTDGTETVLELIDFAQPTAEDFEPTGPVTPSG